MIFNKPTLVTITAPTCSGKTYLIEHLEKLGMNRIVGFTTREKRNGEVDGVHYYFISNDEAQQLEADGKLAETATFRGNRYGVTHEEMQGKIDGEFPPVIILEPHGLNSYEKICRDNNWDIFKIYVTVPEALKIKRLNERTADDIRAAIKKFNYDNIDCFGVMVGHDRFVTIEPSVIDKLVEMHTSRLLSITGEERLWKSQNTWDAVVPGDDLDKAVHFIEHGVRVRNKKQ